MAREEYEIYKKKYMERFYLCVNIFSAVPTIKRIDAKTLKYGGK